MSAAGTQQGEITLTLNEEERAALLLVLEQKLHDTLIEAHRTEAPDYREHIERRAAVLERLIARLRPH